MKVIITIFSFLLICSSLLHSQSYFWELKKAGFSYLGAPMTVERNNIKNVYYCSSNIVYKSTDYGNTFEQLGTAVPETNILSNIIVNENNPQKILVSSDGTNSDKIFKTTDSGNSWTATFDRGIRFPRNIVLVTDPNHPDTVYASSDSSFFRSLDFGDNWDTLSTTVPDGYTCDIEIFPDIGIILIAKSYTGIVRSTDYGYTWTNVYPTANEIPFFEINKNVPGLIWATQDGVNGGVIKSTDYGENWESVPFFNNIDTWGIAVNPQNSQYLYIAQLPGDVFISHDGGNTWIGANIPDLNVQVYAADTMNVFAVQSNGLYKLNSPFFPNDVDDNNTPITTKFSLTQNYPNPFNPTTEISYSIPQTSKVTLKVYDILGREVTTLVNEEKTASNYEIEFDRENLSSGIYFYQLKAGSFVETKKMILLR